MVPLGLRRAVEAAWQAGLGRGTPELACAQADAIAAVDGPLDADLSVLRDAAENIPLWVAIWQARREPDAHARRCAADAIGAADEALAAIHRIRAELVTQVRRADDQAAARADALVARTRDGPQGHHSLEATAPLDPAATQTPKSSASRVTRGGNGGPAPCEVAP